MRCSGTGTVAETFGPRPDAVHSEVGGNADMTHDWLAARLLAAAPISQRRSQRLAGEFLLRRCIAGRSRPEPRSRTSVTERRRLRKRLSAFLFVGGF